MDSRLKIKATRMARYCAFLIGVGLFAVFYV
jgi:hypothetical protein